MPVNSGNSDCSMIGFPVVPWASDSPRMDIGLVVLNDKSQYGG